MRKYRGLTDDGRPAALAEVERRDLAVRAMLGVAERRFPGIAKAVLTARWGKELDAYVAEPLERRGGR